jgi:hypothetical protein
MTMGVAPGGPAVDPLHAADVFATFIAAMGAPGSTPARSSASPSYSTTAVAAPTAPVAPTGPSPDNAFPVEGGGPDTPINSPYGGERHHGGIDFGVPVGAHLVAAISGTVTHAAGDDPGGYGNWVEITGANGISVRYGHLSEISVAQGDTVTAGQVIGSSGGAAGAPGSGNSSGPHLHFEVRQDGQSIDPGPFLAGSMPIVAQADTTTKNGVTTTPFSPERVIGAQLTNIVSAIAGQTPTAQATQTTETPAQPGLGTPNEPGTPGNATGNWAQDILAGIGAPITPENVRAIEAWMRAEGMGPENNNPLATTQQMDGEVGTINSVGVRHYASYEQGLAATIRTILNGNYGNIIAALRAGDNALAVADAIAASPWGTGGLVKKILSGG